jgi:hypothetical protein
MTKVNKNMIRPSFCFLMAILLRGVIANNLFIRKMSATRDGNKIDLSSSWSYMTTNNNFIYEVRGGSDSGSYSRRQDYRGEYDRNYDDKFDGRGNFEESTDYYDDKYGDTDHSDRSYVGKDKVSNRYINS